MSDNNGEMCIPGVGAYYPLSTKFGNLGEHDVVGLFNPNLVLKYFGTDSYTCVGLNKMVIGEIIIQFSSKIITHDLNEHKFLQTLAEVKRFYKRSTNQVGNLTLTGK